MYSRKRWEGELIGGVNRNKITNGRTIFFFKIRFFYRFIDRQTKRKKNVNWCTNCLIVSHLLSLVFSTILVLYQLIMKLKWHVEKNLKLKSIFRIFFSRLFSCLCTLYTRFHQGGGFCLFSYFLFSFYKSRNNICTTGVNWRTIAKTVAAVRSAYGNCIERGREKVVKVRLNRAAYKAN